jgi:hypothetical protein
MQRFLTLLIIVLGVTPLWSSHFLPMVDLPHHAAQVATILALDRPDFPFRDLFWINWFNPYLLGYFITMGLAKFLPIMPAMKLVLTASLIAYVFAFRWLRGKFNADPSTDWAIIPAWYGFAFNWGFFNFLIGLPLLLVFLGLVIQSLEKWNRTNVILVIAGINLLFFAHALLAALGCLIAVELAFLKHRRIADQVRCATPVLSVLPLALFWLVLTKHREATQANREIIMSFNGSRWSTLSLLNPLSQSIEDKWWTHAAGLVLFALPFIQRGKAVYDLMRWAPFLTVVFITLFVPTMILGTAFVSDRFSVLVFPFYLLGFTSGNPSFLAQPVRRLLLPGAITSALLTAILLRIASFNSESIGFSYILQSMEPAKRVLTLTIEPRSRFSSAPVYMHFPVWYQAEKTGVVDYSFSDSFPVMVRYRSARDPSNSGFLALHPKAFNWKLHQGWRYDYFVVRASSSFQQQLFADANCPIKLVTEKNGWWLYERDKSTPCIAQSVAAPILPKDQRPD